MNRHRQRSARLFHEMSILPNVSRPSGWHTTASKQVLRLSHFNDVSNSAACCKGVYPRSRSMGVVLARLGVVIEPGYCHLRFHLNHFLEKGPDFDQNHGSMMEQLYDPTNIACYNWRTYVYIWSWGIHCQSIPRFKLRNLTYNSALRHLH